MSDYTIALIREDQIAETQALMSRCFEAKLASIFYLHPESTLAVTYQGKVVAGINLDIYQVNKRVRMGYIGWLYTDEGHRGKALAGRLLNEAIIFLKNEGCTSLCACVEGDNPASFKQLAKEGFSILSLWQQLKLFKVGTAKVYHHASRFFDMGYFLWHKSLTEQSIKEAAVGSKPFFLTLLGNTILFFFCLQGWNLLNLAGFHPYRLTFSSLSIQQHMMTLALPSLFLLARTAGMFLPAKNDKKMVVYRSWDTAWILSLILTLTIGLPFPVPGNLYIKGLDWNLNKERHLLARMGIAGQASVALVCLFSPKGIPLLFGLALLALDGFFFFYPFCGFNASRIKRMTAKTYALSLAITLAVILMLLVY
ncbi:MAG TPA: GNAT family N-acetyltransferase [Sphaerochaeta sp.]|nr:GNAT family N-acetyltransferase [Sphaerochaeta sp.]